MILNKHFTKEHNSLRLYKKCAILVFLKISVFDVMDTAMED